MTARILAFGLALALNGCPHNSGAQDLASLPAITTSDPDAEADLREAREAAEAGRAADAEQRYRAFLVEHPTDPLLPLARLGLGRVLLANGDVPGALAELDVVAAASDERIAEAGRFYRGVALQLAGQHEEALALLQPIVGHTSDPEDTVLLLRTIAAAAQRLDRPLVALVALDQLAGSTRVAEIEREQARRSIREIVQAADAPAVHQAYDQLPRDGAAWPQAALRAIRLAFDAGEMPTVLAMVTELRARNVPLDDELAQLAVRAERTERADARVIGAIVPLTGTAGLVGQRAVRGLMLASGAPANGPPGADAPQLVLRDDGGDPERAARAVEDLVAVHRAIAIVGPLQGPTAEAAARRAQELGVPLITLVPNATVAQGRPMVFRLLPDAAEEAGALVRAAQARGATRFAVLYPSGPYGQRMRDEYARALVVNSGTLVAEQAYPADATSFGEAIGRLAAAHFDAIFVPDLAAKLALIAPALAAAGLWSTPAGGTPARGGTPIVLMAPSIAVDARVLHSAGRYLQGALFSTLFHAQSAQGPGQAFVDAYQTANAQAPDVYAAYAYDAYRLARRGVDGGQVTRDSLARWLAEAGRDETIGASGGVGPERGPANGARVLELRGDQLVAP